MAATFSVEGPATKFFGNIVSILTSLLHIIPSMSKECQMLSLKWLDSVSYAIESIPKDIVRTNSLITKLRQTLLLTFIDGVFGGGFIFLFLISFYF